MNTRVSYLGLDLPHPFIVGASPLGDTVSGAREAEDAGAAALVLRSLFEEQIDAEAMATYESMESHADAFAEATHFMPDPVEFRIGPQNYLEHLRRVKEAVKIPVIASLNGTTLGGWLSYGRAIQEMGADALELNIFDVPMNEYVSAEDIEKETTEMIHELWSQLDIPIAVKIGPFYTSLPHFAKRLEGAGAAGLVLFNRFFEPDIDVEKLMVLAEMRLSDSRELLLRLRWLSILSGLLDKTSLAVTGGVHQPLDAVKAIMCGASCVQVVAALLRNGISHIDTLRSGLVEWMLQNEYESVESMRGSMNILRSPNPDEFSRANYMRTLQTWNANPSGTRG
jgi:dihydroorotate dehydrogenase (fumarate)